VLSVAEADSGTASLQSVRVGDDDDDDLMTNINLLDFGVKGQNPGLHQL